MSALQDTVGRTLGVPLGGCWPHLTPRLLSIALLKSRSNLSWNLAKLPTDLLDLARQQYRTPWPQLQASDIVRFHREGDRLRYESVVRARQERLTVMSLAASITKETIFLDEVVDGVVLLCEQLSWCWPAHDDTYEKQGWFLPDTDHPFLDLGASEIAVQLACVDLLLGEKIDQHCPGLVELIRKRIEERAFTPFLDRSDWHWLGIETPPHNWAAWIHSNLLISTLALGDPSYSEVSWRSLEGINRYLDVIPGDGSIDEGVGYWWNGVARVLGAFEWLSLATDGKILPVPNLPNVHESMLFPLRLWMGGNKFLSFSDSSPQLEDPVPWGMLSRLSSDPNVRYLSHTMHSDISCDLGLQRILPELQPSPPLTQENSTCAESVLLPELELWVGRANGATVTLKGGHNGENHNHNDVGSLTYWHGSHPVLIDPGRLTYTGDSFGPQRYDTWAYQSQWHCLPLIDGTQQYPGSEYHARDFHVHQGDENLSASVDIAGAYPGMDHGTWQRKVVLMRSSGDILVTEKWTNISRHHRLFFTASGIAHSQSEREVLLMGEYGEIHISSSCGKFTIERKEMTDPIMRKNWGDSLLRLTLHIPDDKKETQWTVKRVLQ